MSSLFDRAPEILAASRSGTGEHYAWGVLLLVLSSEKEAAKSEDPPEDNRPEQ
jgi:hypothetical protein